MEEEKTQPADHQLEPTEEALLTPGATAAAAAAAAAAVVAGAHDVHMQQGAVAGEEADRQGHDAVANAIAGDEEIAHALHMHEPMQMDESELRRPSLLAALEIPLGAYGSLTTFSEAGAGAGAGSQATAGSGIAGLDVPPQARGAFLKPYVRPPPRGIVHEAETLRRNAPPPPEGGIAFLPRPVTLVTTPRAGTNITPIMWRPRDVAAYPGRLTHFSQVGYPAGPSSSRQVPGDEVAALPSKTPPASVAASAGCTPYAATAPARPDVPVDDVVSSKRRALLADADSSVIFAGMEEGDDNGWYESIIRDDEKLLEDMEELQLGLHESLQQCAPRSVAPNDESPAAVAAGEEGGEFSLVNFCERWGINPSDLGPDEPDPSTKRLPKVPPLADDEVPKFDCGICMETLDVFDLFHGLPCKHKFCAACMSTYVEGRIRAGELPIPCPDTACKGEDGGILHPEKCKKAIDFAAFSDWGARLTERAVPPSRRAYCPNRRCGVMLETSGEERPAMAPCPACNHLLCAACGMEWSADGSGEHDCAKGPDAALVRKLAQDRKWKQCPMCKMMVERIAGCRRMTCRCNSVFCYQCGLPILRSQVGEGSEICRCNDAGLAFAHQHQAHPFDADNMHQQEDHLPDADMAP